MTTTATTAEPARLDRRDFRSLLTLSTVRVREHPEPVGVFLLAGLASALPVVGELASLLATVFAVGLASVVLVGVTAGDTAALVLAVLTNAVVGPLFAAAVAHVYVEARGPDGDENGDLAVTPGVDAGTES